MTDLLFTRNQAGYIFLSLLFKKKLDIIFFLVFIMDHVMTKWSFRYDGIEKPTPTYGSVQSNESLPDLPEVDYRSLSVTGEVLSSGFLGRKQICVADIARF